MKYLSLILLSLISLPAFAFSPGQCLVAERNGFEGYDCYVQEPTGEISYYAFHGSLKSNWINFVGCEKGLNLEVSDNVTRIMRNQNLRMVYQNEQPSADGSEKGTVTYYMGETGYPMNYWSAPADETAEMLKRIPDAAVHAHCQVN